MSTAIATMTSIPADAFIYSFDDVAATQDSMMDRTDAKYALVRIPIERVFINENTHVAMDDEELEENDDTEYMEDLVAAVQAEGADVFPPSVVIERDGFYEWIDGQHRMTALVRAGVETTMAYVGRI